MFKKIYSLIFIITTLLFVARSVGAEEKRLNIYFFWGDGCPHCTSEKSFLEEIKTKYKNIKVYDYEVWNNDNNRKLLSEVSRKIGFVVSGVPITIIGDESFSGFTLGLTSERIEKRVDYCLNNQCLDLTSEIILSDWKVAEQDKKDSDEKVSEEKNVIPEIVTFPIFGKIEIKNFTLPVITIILGALDGFNPCAMWTLIFLIGLLLGIEDKKKRWFLGTLFIVSSAIVYFLFMATWLNIILFVGFIVWVKILIGLIALSGGGYNLREFIINKDNACKVTKGENRKVVFERLKDIIQEKNFLIATVGMIVLAFVVNLVELICSAGLPVIFTQILALSNIPKWQHYLYMVLYIFVFMLDDLLVFFTAMITFEITGLSSKYVHFSHLVGGILMVIVGLLLLFKPQWLMFG